MTTKQFRALIIQAETLEGKYKSGYRRGLRRQYHGERFGTAEEHEKLLGRDDEYGRGYRDGWQATGRELTVNLTDAAALYWGAAPLPPGAVACGTVTRETGEIGALVLLHSGNFVQGNAGSFRTLHGDDVLRAVEIPADLLLQARQRHEHTQAQAAAVVLVESNTWARWERGESAPKNKAVLLALLRYVFGKKGRHDTIL
jgi:DNA-binding transcriptional regulator YiaG